MIQIIVGRGGYVYPKIGPKYGHTVSALLSQHQSIIDQYPIDERYNIFYTLAHHSGATTSSFPQRTAATFAYQEVLAWDIDAADTDQPVSYALLLSQLLECKPEDLSIVVSGNGVHLIANLKSNCTIRSAEYFKKNKGAYAEVCFRLTKLMEEHGLPGSVDTSIFEPARILRLPGTVNKKEGKPDTECRLVHASETALDLNLTKISGLADIAEENVSPVEIRRQYPRPDFEAMFDGCIFMQWAAHTPTEVHEPHAFDLFSLLSNVQPASKVQFNDIPVGPQDLGRHVFDGAKESASLAKVAFEDKWAQSGRYGARTCATIDARWGRCKECPNYGKVPTPLALKGPDHIGSDVNGYWVLDKRGNYKHPNYADLVKLYLKQNYYITGRGERLKVFERTHYKAIEPMDIRRWMIHTMSPNHPLRVQHMHEFVEQVKVNGSISEETEVQLFNDTIMGKLNCANGVLDIKTGELLTHVPSFGFQYVLPYDYVPDGASEYFLNWLEIITEHRVELIESLLDIMAYCLWPSYDDHMFTYLVGEGSNGKSTLINIIRALVGKGNHSGVSISQLTKNRFQPSELEGKLVNLSEESSGDELNSEELNILKNLSSGGQLMIERKNKQGYLFENKAKLIFAANKVPKFYENNEAIKRRLAVIPFDHIITERDPQVEARLISEVPLILPMLISRIRENIKLNGGKFVVSRNSNTHVQAQRKFLTSGSPIKEWADESIEITSSLNDFVQVSECYSHYKQWCEMNGYKYVSPKNTFSKTILSFILPNGSNNDPFKKIGGRTQRVYRRVRFKNQEGVSSDSL